MNKGFFLVLLMSFLMVGSVFAVECDADLNVTPCNVTQNLTLNGGVHNVVDTISITANDVVFDGNGATINGSGSGFLIKVTADNVILSNLNIQNTEYGVISYYPSDNLTIDNVNISSMSKRGITAYIGSSGTFTNINLNGYMSEKGMFLTSASNVLVENISIIGTGFATWGEVGLDVRDGNNTIIQNVDVTDGSYVFIPNMDNTYVDNMNLYGESSLATYGGSITYNNSFFNGTDTYDTVAVGCLDYPDTDSVSFYNSVFGNAGYISVYGIGNESFTFTDNEFIGSDIVFERTDTLSNFDNTFTDVKWIFGKHPLYDSGSPDRTNYSFPIGSYDVDRGIDITLNGVVFDGNGATINSSINYPYAYIVNISANDVVINDLIVTGVADSLYISGAYNNILIANSTFTTNSHTLRAVGNYIYPSNVVVDNIYSNAGGYFIDIINLTIKDSVFDMSGVGNKQVDIPYSEGILNVVNNVVTGGNIRVRDFGGVVNITNNTVKDYTNCLQYYYYPFSLSNIQNGGVVKNNIVNNSHCYQNNIAVNIFGTTKNLLLEDNIFRGYNSDSLLYFDTYGGSATNLSFINNDIDLLMTIGSGNTGFEFIDNSLKSVVVSAPTTFINNIFNYDGDYYQAGLTIASSDVYVQNATFNDFIYSISGFGGDYSNLKFYNLTVDTQRFGFFFNNDAVLSNFELKDSNFFLQDSGQTEYTAVHVQGTGFSNATFENLYVEQENQAVTKKGISFNCADFTNFDNSFTNLTFEDITVVGGQQFYFTCANKNSVVDDIFFENIDLYNVSAGLYINGSNSGGDVVINGLNMVVNSTNQGSFTIANLDSIVENVNLTNVKINFKNADVNNLNMDCSGSTQSNCNLQISGGKINNSFLNGLYESSEGGLSIYNDGVNDTLIIDNTIINSDEILIGDNDVGYSTKVYFKNVSGGVKEIIVNDLEYLDSNSFSNDFDVSGVAFKYKDLSYLEPMVNSIFPDINFSRFSNVTINGYGSRDVIAGENTSFGKLYVGSGVSINGLVVDDLNVNYVDSLFCDAELLSGEGISLSSMELSDFYNLKFNATGDDFITTRLATQYIKEATPTTTCSALSYSQTSLSFKDLTAVDGKYYVCYKQSTLYTPMVIEWTEDASIELDAVYRADSFSNVFCDDTTTVENSNIRLVTINKNSELFGNTFRGLVSDSVVGSKFCDYDSDTGNYWLSGSSYSGLNVGNCVQSSEFGLSTTDFSTVSDWSSVDLVLENSKGVVDWVVFVDLSGYQEVDFDSLVDVEQDKITVRSELIPSLNSSASLTFKNVNALNGEVIKVYSNPILNWLCNIGVICLNNNYDKASRVYEMDVTHFSTYELDYDVVLESDDTTMVIFDVFLKILVGFGMLAGVVGLYFVLRISVNLFNGKSWNEGLKMKGGK